MTSKYLRMVAAANRPLHVVDPSPTKRGRKPHGTAKRERQQRCALAELASLWHQPKDRK